MTHLGGIHSEISRRYEPESEDFGLKEDDMRLTFISWEQHNSLLSACWIYKWGTFLLKTNHEIKFKRFRNRKMYQLIFKKDIFEVCNLQNTTIFILDPVLYKKNRASSLISFTLFKAITMFLNHYRLDGR